jgi:hypothetical protein
VIDEVQCMSSKARTDKLKWYNEEISRLTDVEVCVTTRTDVMTV